MSINGVQSGAFADIARANVGKADSANHSAGSRQAADANFHEALGRGADRSIAYFNKGSVLLDTISDIYGELVELLTEMANSQVVNTTSSLAYANLYTQMEELANAQFNEGTNSVAFFTTDTNGVLIAVRDSQDGSITSIDNAVASGAAGQGLMMGEWISDIASTVITSTAALTELQRVDQKHAELGDTLDQAIGLIKFFELDQDMLYALSAIENDHAEAALSHDNPAEAAAAAKAAAAAATLATAVDSAEDKAANDESQQAARLVGG